jgi:hypothetical protein
VTCVPTLLHMLLSHRAAADVHLRGWKLVIDGSALSKGRSGGLAFAPSPNLAPRKDGLILCPLALPAQPQLAPARRLGLLFDRVGLFPEEHAIAPLNHSQATTDFGTQTR